MGILDWIHKSDEPDRATNLSRRDFFARFAGRTSSDERAEEEEGPQVVCTFSVSSFPYFDGPVLVPMLRPDLDFKLTSAGDDPVDPNGVRILWGKDHLGNVPAEHSEHLRLLLADGIPLRCRASRVDPTALLTHVLEVEVSIVPDPSEDEPFNRVGSGS